MTAVITLLLGGIILLHWPASSLFVLGVPLALLIILLVRLDRLTKEVAALRRRVGVDEDRGAVQAEVGQVVAPGAMPDQIQHRLAPDEAVVRFRVGDRRHVAVHVPIGRNGVVPHAVAPAVAEHAAVDRDAQAVGEGIGLHHEFGMDLRALLEEMQLPVHIEVGSGFEEEFHGRVS